MLGGASCMLWKAVQATRGALPCWRDTSGAYLHMHAASYPAERKWKYHYNNVQDQTKVMGATLTIIWAIV